MSEHDGVKASVEPSGLPVQPCLKDGHCLMMVHGPYKKLEQRPLGYADDDTAMYFVFICAKCGVVLETKVSKIAPPRRA